jgi:hypothetical protein
MKRWHVVAPDAETAKSLYDEFMAAGVETTHIHLVAKDHAVLTAVGLPEPTEVEEKMVAGEGVGRLMSGIMGTAPSDPKVAEFKADIEAGRILMVVIFPKERIDAIRALLGNHKQVRSPELERAAQGT